MWLEIYCKKRKKSPIGLGLIFAIYCARHLVQVLGAEALFGLDAAKLS